MVMKNTTGRGNSIYDVSNHNQYNLAGVQAVFSLALLLSKALWKNTSFTTMWLVLTGGDGRMCTPFFFVMTAAGELTVS